MKKHSFDSLTDFYADITNKVNRRNFNEDLNRDDKSWVGLTLADCRKFKFSYSIGVADLMKFKEAKIEKPERIKFFNQFDGYDIDIDRMYENMDFILDIRKIKKLPKNIDIFINIAESWYISYQEMLNKTFAAIKIIDHWESLGVRCSLYAIMAMKIIRVNGIDSYPTVVEICIKTYHDSLNLGAICTAISPWMFRYYGINWYYGNNANVGLGCGYPVSIPKEALTPNCIVIDNQKCLTLSEANDFIEKIKVVA